MGIYFFGSNRKKIKTENSGIIYATLVVVNTFFNQWLQSNYDKLPNKIILDFGFIESVSNDLVTSFAPILSLLKGKTVIVMSGAVPNSIPVASDENYKFPRIEKELFNEMKKISSNDTDLMFGDYSSVSPIISTGGRAIVQVKYTLDNDYWFVRNGLRQGNYDFVKVCQQIASLSGFDEKYCWGDEYIKSVVDDNTNKGNPSVWTSIGVNRHTVVCLNEL
ncbi:beta family protein [Oceanobacillus luteolus]|uniref:Beta family protein n=1 Tax=Oceanobacillus luteolus TaxID=1274358 RepID=A0ABW4HT77_9BACI|nr:beta family protein [Oceanobacillus luteolus]MCM3742102.1 beta family protein [Oceanobacillus luteolus]